MCRVWRTGAPLALAAAALFGPGKMPALALQDQEIEEDNPENGSLPLEGGKDNRIVHFDMTAGSWLSVDVSPDGQTIVFDYLGDLFTIPSSGGEATQITSGMAFDAQPRFSPDGSRVVFTSDRDGGQNIWIMSLDGNDTTQVSEGKANRAESPEWSPDGSYVVASMGGFRGGGLPKLHLFHIDGGSGADLIRGENPPKTIGAAFGPDPRWVWYSERTSARDWDYNAQFPLYRLRAYDRETGQSYTRVSRYGGAIRPTLSPDGKWLVYGTRHDEHTGLVLRDLQTGAERWLAYPVQRDDQESRAALDALPGMSFTPDSRAVVASYGGKIWRIPVLDEGGHAEEIPFRVRFDLEIGPKVDFDYPVSDAPTFTVRQIRDAVPSPDGTRLAFTAMDHLYVANADGSDPRRITRKDDSEHMPTWSPDGEWLAYASWSEVAGGHLYKARADGAGDPVRLSRQPGIFVTPAWAPDGQRIVAVRGFARAFESSSSPRATGVANELVWLPAEGGDATLIMPIEDRSSPHFVESGERIFLFKSPDELVSVRWDGTNEQTRVKVRGEKSPGSEQRQSPEAIAMAPTGDLAMASILGQIYTLTVPMVGGDAPTVNVADSSDASFPVRKLTRFGGEFPAWGRRGRAVHWSLGNAHFMYDLDAAAAHEDSVKAADKDEDDGYQAGEFRITISAQRDLPVGSAVLRGARVITMRGDEVIGNADVVVRDNRIVNVARSGSIALPDNARVIDMSGKTIIPGFVDTHAHLRPSWGIHRKDQWVYLANLAYGVTTTRDPQTATTDVLTYSDLVRSGDVLGPRIYSTGPGISFQNNIDDLDEARDIMRRYSDYYDTKTLKMYVAGNRKQRQLIVMAAREMGIMPTTEGSLNVKQNLTETIDGYSGLEHSIPVYPLYDDFVKLFVESGRTYTPTLLVSYGGPWAENYFYTRENPHDDDKLRRFMPHSEVDVATRRRGGGPSPGPAGWFHEDEHVFQDHAKFVAALVAAGGKAGVGSHGQLQGLAYHWELWAIQSGGLPEHDALRVATLIGAQAIGLDQDLGSIEAGKLADMIILDANPLDNIRNTNTIRWVMKNGRLYEGDTLNEIYPVERDLEPLWWWTDEPTSVPGLEVGGN